MAIKFTFYKLLHGMEGCGNNVVNNFKFESYFRVHMAKSQMKTYLIFRLISFIQTEECIEHKQKFINFLNSPNGYPLSLNLLLQIDFVVLIFLLLLASLGVFTSSYEFSVVLR